MQNKTFTFKNNRLRFFGAFLLILVFALPLNSCKQDDTFERIKSKIHLIIQAYVNDSSNFTLQNSPDLSSSIAYHQLDFSTTEIQILQSEFDKGTVIKIWSGKDLGTIYKTDRKRTLSRHRMKVNGFFFCSGPLHHSLFYRRYANKGTFTPLEENWFRFEYVGTE